jgi:hypothetical protein
MARQQKTSALEDLLDLVSRLSWKIALPLALLCYLGFHDFSTLPAANDATSTPDTAIGIIRQAVIALCDILQYLAPLVLFAGVIVGTYRRRQRRAVLERNWEE